jgi:hypothetical protein
MALTNTQKTLIRTYLGYSDMSRQGFLDLEGVMNNLAAEAETLVGTYLTQLAAVDAGFTTGSSSALAVAGLKSVDNGAVVWQDGAGAVSAALSSQGRMLVGRLSTILGIPVIHDPYGGGSRSGFAGRA